MANMDTPAVQDGHAMREELRATLDMLVWPHPDDGKFAGSTMGAAIDRWRKWCSAAGQMQLRTEFADSALVDLLVERVCGALSLSHTTTVSRVRALLNSYLDLWDRAYASSEPPQDIVRALLAHAEPDSASALALADVLLSRYGTSALTNDARAYFAALIGAVQSGHGSVGRRSRLAVAFSSAVRAEGFDADVWLAPIADGLVHSDERAVDNIVAHLVVPLLDTADVLVPLVQLLGGDASEGRVRALLAVLRVSKTRELCVIGDTGGRELAVPTEIVSACVTSAVPRVQVAALALAVDAKTPAAPLTHAELHVITEFFSQSLMLPSAVARKDSIALLVKLLVRVRVSAHASKRSGSADISAYQALGASLVRLVVHAMHPGAPYACTSLALAMLLLVFEAEAPGEPVDDSALADAVRALAKARRTYPGDFALDAARPSEGLVRHLCHLAAHSTYSDVQDMAALLLLRIGARTELPGLSTPQQVRERLVRPSLALLVSQKDAEAHGGVCLVRVYRALCERWPHEPLQDIADAARAPVARSLVGAHLALLDSLLSRAESAGLASASDEHALNGALAVVRVLGVDGCALERVRRVWAIVRPVLTAAAPEGGDGDDAEIDAPGASQRVLSYAWRAMREAAALTAAVVDRAPEYADAANALFVEWLLTIRHRGAFSTIYPCYQQMAKTLLASASREKPAEWLAALLDNIERNCASMSTTRRSAGLGYAVLALLSAYPSRAQSEHIEFTMCALRRLSQSDVVPTIHALNIMRVLVMDSTLAGSMSRYTNEVLTHAVRHFSADAWGVRNASMMLFAATSTRMFGARAFESGATAGSPSDELGDALVHILEKESHVLSADALASVGHGSALYAVLLLLGKMRPRAALGREALAAVERCIASANWKLREQAARCYASLVNDPGAAQRFVSSASLADQNQLHGALMAATALVERGAAVELPLALLVDNPCPATCEAYLRLARAARTSVDKPWLASFFSGTSAVARTDPFVAWLLPTALRVAADECALPSLVGLLRESDDARDAVVALLHEQPQITEPGLDEALVAVVLDSRAALSGRVGAADVLDSRGRCVRGDELIELAISTPSVALRDAVLPLLGRVTGAQDDIVVAAILAECARETASVSSRLGVCRALRSMETLPVHGKHAYTLWHTVLTLLRDDDSDVRTLMADLVSDSLRRTLTIPGSPLAPLAPSVEALPAGLESCADRVWARLREADEGECAAELWRIMTSDLSGDTDVQDAALFPAEEANQFYDPVGDMLRAYRTFSEGLELPVVPCADVSVLENGAPYRVLLQSALVASLAQHDEQSTQRANAVLERLSIAASGPSAHAFRRLRIA